MRFSNLKAKGIGPFREEIAIDFDAIEGKLVAITGGNGEGKSTLLELLAGGMYRSCPTRGSLASLATARDAFLEVGVVNGSSHRLRHVLDSVSGKGESVVSNDAGQPLVASGKLKEFDAWASKHLPPPEVLYSSTFAAQGSGGFLDLKPAERKGVLLRVLGIERLEALAEKAREHVRATKIDITTLDARIADERARASDPASIFSEIEALKQQRSDLEASLSRAKEALAELVQVEEQAKTARRAAEDVARRRTETSARIEAARTKLADLTKRLTNNEGLQAQSSEIRAAEARAAELDKQLVELGTDISDARVELATATRDRSAARDTLSAVTARAQRSADRKTRIEARLADRATIDVASASLPDLRAAVTAEEVIVEAIEESIRKATEFTLADAGARLTNLRAPLRTIAQGADEPASIAKGALVGDDLAAKDAIEVPKKIAEDRRKLEEARTHLATKRSKLTVAERTAARATELEAADAELAEVKAEIARFDEEDRKARAAVDASTARATAKQSSLDALTKTQGAIEIDRAKLDPLVKLGERLTQAEVRIAELSPQAAAARSEIAALEEQLAGLPEIGEVALLPDVLGARKVVETVDGQLRKTEAAIAVKEAQHTDALASAKRLAELEGQRKRLDDELADWTRVADDLGRDGLQALEIDAAGPELTELVNDLLRTCVGARWTVTIEASRLSGDGKKMLEGCEVRVLDTERGREGSAESLSGGERVLVGEAVSLALSMLACRRSGVQGPTLVRDESGAALDPMNARAYVAMLRRAAEIVGASHVLFVSHSQEVQDLADARIEVCGGKVRVAA